MHQAGMSRILQSAGQGQLLWGLRQGCMQCRLSQGMHLKGQLAVATSRGHLAQQITHLHSQESLAQQLDPLLLLLPPWLLSGLSAATGNSVLAWTPVHHKHCSPLAGAAAS